MTKFLIDDTERLRKIEEANNFDFDEYVNQKINQNKKKRKVFDSIIETIRKI